MNFALERTVEKHMLDFVGEHIVEVVHIVETGRTVGVKEKVSVCY